MLVSVLASGSEGNCTYVETDDAKILIDAGMNLKYINEKLEGLGTSISEIDYILMTHAHSDHVGALPNILKKYSPTLVVSEGIYEELEIIHGLDNIIIGDDKIISGKTVIDNFKTSHDAKGSRGYIISDDNSSMVYMTDTGYLHQKYFNKLYNKTLYVIEANHDVEMLINGKYPKWLKSRILSDRGHLSNNACGFYLSKMIGPDTKKVVLAHLSKENNKPEVAVSTVLKTLKEYDIDFSEIEIAKQNEKTENFSV